MVAIYAYNSAELDMTAPQIPDSEVDLDSLVVYEYTNWTLTFQVDIAGYTIGAEYVGNGFIYKSNPDLYEFRLYDEYWNTLLYVGDFDYKYYDFAELVDEKGLDNPTLLSGADEIYGDSGDDYLKGYRGADDMWGDSGDDTIRAGNGRDEIWGDEGSDVLYGGFGKNTFLWEDDGDMDKIIFKSDQYAYNWVYDSDGNSPNGEKADTIYELDYFDEIYVQGVATEELSFRQTSDGIGIFANGTLEATYVGSDLDVMQISDMTFGLPI